jgi:SOS response regulatory protein OraA/RecX
MKTDSNKPKSATSKIMEHLARRDHSELEIRQKIADGYSPEEIEAAIQYAKESRWLRPAQELAERIAENLSRKQKGHDYIAEKLREKGLPGVAKDPDAEFAKAKLLIRTKLAKKLKCSAKKSVVDSGLNSGLESAERIEYEQDEDQKKVYRLLANRGFDEETIVRAIAWAQKTTL